ncbi:uncharacterized protein LOC134795118 [Cydia splendana]|uniref:uncharacterized protein LOC134795118 n=1 Tax=Cydia splendana TaxID=1100963 RepID=UPI00300D0891
MLLGFEGDFEILGDPQIKLIENVLQKQGYTNGKVLVEPVGQKGDNYIAHVKRFIYESGEGSTFKMIGKIAPVAEELRNIMKTMLLFNNEIVMYNLVLPKLNDLQNLVGNNKDKVRFPTCYGVVNEAPYEFILLEDLKESGLEMLDRLKYLTNDSIRIVIKDLAIYHSLSYVLKILKRKSFINSQTNCQIFRLSENDLLKLLGDESDKYKNLVTGSITEIPSNARDIQNDEKGSKYTVIQQVDCWNNNILFRLEDGKPRKPVGNVMIDYQMSKESSPAADILYLLFNCTDHATRLQHYREWIDYYHKILSSTLKKHGLEANLVFPKDQLLADLKRYSRISIGFGLFLSSMLVRESKDVFDFKEKESMLVEDVIAKMNMLSLDKSTTNRLKGRIMGIIDTVLEFGLV